MLSKEILIQRLALIKYLFQIGLENSKKVEPVSAFSILSFHDSIEMFLKLISEHHDIKSDNFNFLDYWTHIPTLTLKESMRNLNARRVNIKHKGLLPSKSDIEITRLNTIDFFDQNVILQCGIKFTDVSLLALISYTKVRTHLEEAQSSLDSSQNKLCIEKTAIAFDELISIYEGNKAYYLKGSPFFFGDNFILNDSIMMGVKDKRMAEFVDKVRDSFRGIQSAIKIMSFGIDYRRYVKFKLLTPWVRRTAEGLSVYDSKRKKLTHENCKYCIDFVLDSSLKLQDFDFDIRELEIPRRF